MSKIIVFGKDRQTWIPFGAKTAWIRKDDAANDFSDAECGYTGKYRYINIEG